MKRITFLQWACLLLAFCGFSLQTQAQFVLASTPDNSASGPGTATNVVHTGTAEVEIPLGGTPFQVNCWDGASPSWSWDLGGFTGTQPIAGTGFGTVSDPDIVADPTAAPGSERVLIVYILNGRVFFEVHQRFGFAFANIVPPTMINGGATPCSFPNVDVSRLGNVAFTYTQNGTVFGRGYNLPALALSPALVPISGCSGSTNNDRSDVAIFEPSITPGDWVNFVYVATYGTSSARLCLQRIPFATLFGGGAPSCVFGNFHFLDGVSLSTEQFGIPRIACPTQFISFFDPKDLSIVCLKYVNSTATYFVENYTHQAMSWGVDNFNQNTINNAPFNISNCGNKYAAISYVGRFIIPVWIHEDCNGLIPGSGGNLDVVARQLNTNGNPWFFGTYSVVNTNVAGGQYWPSVAGRFSSAYDGFYCFYDQPTQDVLYKSSYFYNQSLKLHEEEEVAEEAAEFGVFPNPITENANITFSIGENEVGQEIAVFDVSGKQVARYNISNRGEGNHTIAWEENGQRLPAGLYIVHLVTDQRSETLKVNKQ